MTFYLFGYTIPEILTGIVGCIIIYGIYKLLTRPSDIFANFPVNLDFQQKFTVLRNITDIKVDDIPTLVKEMRLSFLSGITRSLASRVAVLRKLEKLLVDNTDNILEALHHDLGAIKNFHYSSEIAFAINDLKMHIKGLYSWAQPRSVGDSMATFPSKSYVINEPYGVILVIGTWNFPLSLSLVPVIGAISAGNTCIVKFSNTAFFTSKLLVELFNKYIPSDIVTTIGPSISDDGEAITKLMDQKFDYIMYTGGTRWAPNLLKSAANHLTPMILELGGKNPVIVDSSCNIDLTAKRIVNARMLNAGQICLCPDYVMIEKSIYQELCDRMVYYAKKFYPEHPTDQMERIINNAHTNRLANLLKEEKGDVLFGGSEYVSIKDKYIPPTIISTDFNSPFMLDEIFGPILILIPIDNYREGIEYVNSHSRPLALYIFSENKSIMNNIIHSTSSGGVCVNQILYHFVHPQLPFGGVGKSGYGQYTGKYTYDLFSHSKSVLEKTMIMDCGLLSDHQLMNPPWTESKYQQSKLLL